MMPLPFFSSRSEGPGAQCRAPQRGKDGVERGGSRRIHWRGGSQWYDPQCSPSASSQFPQFYSLVIACWIILLHVTLPTRMVIFFSNSSSGGIASLEMWYSSRRTRFFHSQSVRRLVGSVWSRIYFSGVRMHYSKPSPQENLTPEASKHLGGRRIELTPMSSTFLMQ